MARIPVRTAAGLLGAAALGLAQGAVAACTDPLPIDPAVVTKELSLKAFSGATQAGPVCSLSWEAKSGTAPSLLLYGPTWLDKLGQKFTSKVRCT